MDPDSPDLVQLLKLLRHPITVARRRSPVPFGNTGSSPTVFSIGHVTMILPLVPYCLTGQRRLGV
jgi:hypothetical protein